MNRRLIFCARHFIDEGNFSAERRGADAQFDDGERPARPGLLDDAAFRLAFRGDGFLVGDARLAHVRVHAVVLEQPVLDHFQVQFAHAADDELGGFRVVADFEGRIFAGQLCERRGELLAVGLRARFDRHAHDRRGELHRFEQDGSRRLAERVAGHRVAQAAERDDFAGAGFSRLLFFAVGHHLVDVPDDFLAVAARVVQAPARAEEAGIHADIDEFVVAVRRDLERDRRQRLVRRWLPAGCSAPPCAGSWPITGRHVRRRRQVIADRVEQRMDARLSQRRTAEHRHVLVREGQFADAGAQLLLAERARFEVLAGESVHLVGDRFDQPVAPQRGFLFQLGRHGFVADVHVNAVHIEIQRAHADQVHDALKSLLAPDRDLEHERPGAEPFADRLDDAEEIRAERGRAC